MRGSGVATYSMVLVSTLEIAVSFPAGHFLNQSMTVKTVLGYSDVFQQFWSKRKHIKVVLKNEKDTTNSEG